MQKIISTTYMDKMLILSILADHNADGDMLQKEIMTVSEDRIVFEQKYIGILLYQLRSDRYVERITQKRYEPMHRITKTGRQVLRDHLYYYMQHDKGVRKVLSEYIGKEVL